jgi:hypothetical protein
VTIEGESDVATAADLAHVLLGGFGLGIAIYAAMETEPEQRSRRALLGVLGLVLMIGGIMLY